MIDLEFDAYGVYTDVAEIYPLTVFLWEDIDYQYGCIEYTIFGEQRCNDVDYISHAEIIAGNTIREDVYVIVAQLEAELVGDKIIATIDGKEYEFDSAAELDKFWEQYSANIAKKYDNAQAIIDLLKNETCCNENWPIFTTRKEAEKYAWDMGLVIGGIHAAAEDIGEDPDIIMDAVFS